MLTLLMALTCLPGVALADDDNDNSDKATDKDKPGTSQQTIVPAGARPDLKIEYTGFPPNAEYTVTFKVTNVGTARSTAIKAQVQTLSGGPPNPDTPDVPVLAPGLSHVIYYGFGNCSGSILVIRATVNDPLDVPSVNDRAEGQVCSDPSPIILESPPANDPTEDFGGCAICDLPPPHLRTGSHTIPLDPVAARTFSHGRVIGNCQFFSEEDEVKEQVSQPLFPLVAGFRNYAYSSSTSRDCQVNGVWQAGLRFDLAQIREAWATGRASVVGAELTFTETPFLPVYGSGPHPPLVFGQWITPGEGTNYEPTNTCWPRLARPTLDWRGAGGGLLPNEVLRDAGQAGRWTLLDEMGKILAFPELEVQGFVILGHNEEMHFNNATCQSKIDNVKLTVTYLLRAP
jgi:hypothetical protein